MTFKEEIAALRARLAKAESERDTWRTSGLQEKYLEAYSLVGALEFQLERLRQEGLSTFHRSEERVAAREPSAPPPPDARGDAAYTPIERERLMAEYSIAYNGRHYEYRSYRYERLGDAVKYARLRRAMPDSSNDRGPVRVAETVEAPDDSQRELMTHLAITFEDGVYRVGEYRYDRLVDAMNYARLHPEER